MNLPKFCRLSIFFAAFALYFGSYATGLSEIFTPPAVVSSDATDQKLPDVAYNPSIDQFLVVWQQGADTAVYGSTQVRGQRYSADGQPLGSGFRISATNANGLRPRVVAGNSNTWRVVFKEEYVDLAFAPFSSITTCLVTEQGNVISRHNADTRLGNTQSLGDIGIDFPDVGSASNNGRFLISWVRQGIFPPDDEVRFRIYGEGTDPITADQELTGIYSGNRPAVSRGGPNFFVAWQERGDKIIGRYIGSGHSSSNSQVGGYVSVADGSGNAVSNASVSGIPGLNGWMVTYQYEYSESDQDIYCAFVDSSSASSSTWSGETVATTSALEVRPSVIYNAKDSNFFIAWADGPGGYSGDFDIRGRFVSTTRVKSSTSDLSLSLPSGFQYGSPRGTSFLGDGDAFAPEFAMVWDNSDSIIYGSSWILEPTITVTSPNGGKSWQRGTTQTVTWNSTGNPGSAVKIELLKGGVLDRTIVSSTSNDGSYSWLIDAAQTAASDYRIRVTSTINAAYTDQSDSNFSITAQPTITVTSPNGGKSWQRGTTQTVTWNSTGNPGSDVKIELLKGGVLDRTIVSSTSNDGTYSWLIDAAQTAASDYRIRVTSTTNAAYTDQSNSNFSITEQPTITVTSPNSGDSFLPGDSVEILWDSVGPVGNEVSIQLHRMGAPSVFVITSSAPNNGRFLWSIDPNTNLDFCQIRVSSANATDFSESFLITGVLESDTSILRVPRAGGVLQFTLSSTGNWRGLGDMGQPFGALWFSNVTDGINRGNVFSGNGDQTITIAVDGNSEPNIRRGRIDFELDQLPEVRLSVEIEQEGDDFPSSAESAPEIRLGSEVNGVLFDNDEDYFRFSVDTPGIFRARMTYPPAGDNIQLRILRSSGEAVGGQIDENSGDDYSHVEVLAPGIYVLKVFAWSLDQEISYTMSVDFQEAAYSQIDFAIGPHSADLNAISSVGDGSSFGVRENAAGITFSRSNPGQLGGAAVPLGVDAVELNSALLCEFTVEINWDLCPDPLVAYRAGLGVMFGSTFPGSTASLAGGVGPAYFGNTTWTQGIAGNFFEGAFQSLGTSVKHARMDVRIRYEPHKMEAVVEYKASDSSSWDGVARYDLQSELQPEEISSQFEIGIFAFTDGVALAEGALTLQSIRLAKSVSIIGPTPFDVDGDGLQDDWERLYFGDLAQDSFGDYDGDGSSNGHEHDAGTSPISSQSRLRVTSFDAMDLSGTFDLSWQSVPGKKYVIESSNDLVFWQVRHRVIAVSDLSTYRLDFSDSGGGRFFRVVVE